MELKIFSGNSNPNLAKKICDCLKSPLGKADVSRFSDGETYVEIKDNVRGHDVFIVQSTCQPANENIMEMLVMIDAMKRASAGRITAVLPYYGYARQDRKVSPRVAISAKLVADLLTAAGTDRVLSIDLHAGQIQGFFDIPFDHLFAAPVLMNFLREIKKSQGDVIIVSPDAGGAERARAYAKRLDCGLAIIDKRRERANVSEVMNIIGDVEGKVAILIDDLVDTAGSITHAVPALMKAGAKSVYAAATHPVLSGPAIQRLKDSQIVKLVVTDTIPLQENAKALGKIEVLSIAELLAEAIRRIHSADSISSLFI